MTSSTDEPDGGPRRSATRSTSSTPPCGTAPSARASRYSVADKIAVATLLDELGVGFIEGGWPGAMPKDTEFFARATAGELRPADRVVGRLRRHPQGGCAGRGRPAGAGAAGLRRAGDHPGRQVRRPARRAGAAHHPGGEPGDGVGHRARCWSTNGRRVFLDCEHFFDGYAVRPRLRRAGRARRRSRPAPTSSCCATPTAACCRCPSQRIVGEVLERTGFRLGIHCQDDTGCAVANTVAAVQAGATHVQCTANGYGERAGNADLFAVVGNLMTKMGLPVLPDGALADMMRVSHALAELANIAPNTHQAYVGSSAFSHKAGLHASAIKVDPELYNHLDPTLVGNDMHILITEMAGRASVELKARELGVDLTGRPEAVGRIVDTVKSREAARLVVRGRRRLVRTADARRAGQGPRRRFRGRGVPRAFRLESYRVIVENTEFPVPVVSSEATVKVHVGGQRIIATAEGNGPVNALDSALRSAVAEEFPEFSEVELVDYKVRILAGSAGTDSITRVLVSSARGAQGMDHRRRARQRRRGVLAGAGGRTGLRAAAGRHRRRAPATARKSTGTPRPVCRSPSERRRRWRTPRRVPVRSHEIVLEGSADASGQNRPSGRGRVRHRRRPRKARNGPARSRTTRSARRPTPGARGRWPTPGCWRRSCRPRWSPSAATTPTTPPSSATRCPTSPIIFLKPSTSVIGPNGRDPAAAVVAAGGLRG